MLSPDQTPRAASELFDADAAAHELEALAATYSGRDSELRTAVAQFMKGELMRGREKAEQLLLKERHGRRCAERLCAMQDEIIRVLFEFAGKHLYPSENPSDAERMAVVATGGYGRGLLAPGSDIDLLIPASLQADRLGRIDRRSDPLLPLGHGAEGRARDALGG